MANAEVTVTVGHDNSVRIEDARQQKYKLGRADLSQLRLDTIRILDSWLKAGKISCREELQVLGAHLYEVLFNGEIELFLNSVRSSVSQEERLRVQLNFDPGAAQLASLPWEYLWHPREEFWFSTNVNLVLSRYLPTLDVPVPANLVPDESPMKVLVVVSQPNSLTPVVSAPVVDAIEKLKERYPITVTVLDTPPSKAQFVELLDEHKPHVVHFMGHGRFRADATPPRAEIALHESATNPEVRWCRDQDFAEFFRQAQARPRLVFLHLCESAAVDFTASFAGLAPQLVRRGGIPAVVAMQYPIENRFAILFSRAFYGKLGDGADVDDAVQMARYHLTRSEEAYDSRVFGTPVLYWYSRGGVIRGSTAVARGAASNLKMSHSPVTATGGSERSTSMPPPKAPVLENAEHTLRRDQARGLGQTSVDPKVRSFIMEARQAARAQIEALTASPAEKQSLNRDVSELLEEFRQTPTLPVLYKWWESTQGAMTELVELFIKRWEASS